MVAKSLVDDYPIIYMVSTILLVVQDSGRTQRRRRHATSAGLERWVRVLVLYADHKVHVV